MMISHLFLMALSVSAGSSTRADGQVSDPQKILEQTDAFLGQPAFADSFVAGSTWSYSENDCLGATGTGPCDQMASSDSVAAQIDSAVITTTIPGNPNPTGTETIARQDWDAASGNSLRMHVGVLNSYSYAVALLGVKASSVEVSVDGQTRNLETMQVSLSAKGAMGLQIDETLDLSKELPGPAQVVRARTASTGLVPDVKTLELVTFNH